MQKVLPPAVDSSTGDSVDDRLFDRQEATGLGARVPGGLERGASAWKNVSERYARDNSYRPDETMFVRLFGHALGADGRVQPLRLAGVCASFPGLGGH